MSEAGGNISSMVGARVEDLETPCFLVDLDRVKRNSEKARDYYDKLNMKLRIHIKTHKCIDIGDIQTMGEKKCLCASTVREVEYFADAGYDDILLTSIFTEDKMKRMIPLAKSLQQFHVMLDNDYGIELLEKYPLDGQQWSVFLKLDCGCKRAGIEWDDEKAVQLAQRISSSEAMRLQGLYTFDGNSYVNKCSADTAEKTQCVYNKLKELGIEPPTISIGSTPTGCLPEEKVKLATEMHMGNYVFFDVQQALIGTCKMDDIAVKVMTRVKGHYPKKGTILVDCGFTALSLEGVGKLEEGGMAVVEGHPELVFYKMNQEVGFIKAKEGKCLDFSQYPIGSPLFLFPYHSCATAMQFKHYIIHENGTVNAVWSTCNQEW